ARERTAVVACKRKNSARVDMLDRTAAVKSLDAPYELHIRGYANRVPAADAFEDDPTTHKRGMIERRELARGTYRAAKAQTIVDPRPFGGASYDVGIVDQEAGLKFDLLRMRPIIRIVRSNKIAGRHAE